MEILLSKENMFALFSQKEFKMFLSHDFALKFSLLFFSLKQTMSGTIPQTRPTLQRRI